MDSQAPAHESFRRKGLIASLASTIAAAARDMGPIRIMHVCGTHERSVNRFGLRDLLPKNLKIVAGPGCPVCVCPLSDLAAARKLALRSGVILATFGDMLNVPGADGSLMDARSLGAELRVVYSVGDALTLAKSNPDKEIVFFSIGFETTTAPTAAVVADLEERPVPNFSLISSNRVVPEALDFLLSSGELTVDGLLLPGHVSVIIGSEAYRFLVDRYRIPCAIAGFEPVDLLAAILEILKQKREGKPEIHNSYSRAVLAQGNLKAKALMEKVYEPCDAVWRGLGPLPRTGLRLRPAFNSYDALRKFGLERSLEPEDPVKGCLCAKVMVGLEEPSSCPHFGRDCQPESPVGPCMVSDEGTCRIHYEYGAAR
ncbi:MAG: hydrogenase formation protein HypD [Rectinemataceae bacterium]|jgi:hydrogenase expression/formation protein HypD